MEVGNLPSFLREQETWFRRVQRRVKGRAGRNEFGIVRIGSM